MCLRRRSGWPTTDRCMSRKSPTACTSTPRTSRRVSPSCVVCVGANIIPERAPAVLSAGHSLKYLDKDSEESTDMSFSVADSSDAI